MHKKFAILAFVSGFFVLNFMLAMMGLPSFIDVFAYLGLEFLGSLIVSFWPFILIISIIIFGWSIAQWTGKKQPDNGVKHVRLDRIILALGIILIVGAFPIGFVVDIAAGGCCGFGNIGNSEAIGPGALLGVFLVVGGVIDICVALSMRKRQTK